MENRFNWNALTEKKPDKDGSYIVVTYNGCFIYVMYRDGIWNGSKDNTDNAFRDVVYWAELPEAPAGYHVGTYGYDRDK